MKTIKEQYNECTKCDNCINKQKVFGYGNPNADIMIIGDSPGVEDYDSGVPFSGQSGELLDKALSSIGLDKNDLYYTNTIICRTNEKDRTPAREEVSNCADRLDKEISIVKPNVILMVGSQSLKRFFGDDTRVTDSHGRWFLDFRPPYARYFSIMHPSWALHATTEGESTAKKRVIWEDIKVFRDSLETANFTLKRELEEINV